MRHWTEVYVIQFANDGNPDGWYDVEGLAFSRPRPAVSRMTKLFEEAQERRAQDLAIIPDYVCRGRVVQRLEAPSGVMVELGDGHAKREQAGREAGQADPGNAPPKDGPGYGIQPDPVLAAKRWTGRI